MDAEKQKRKVKVSSSNPDIRWSEHEQHEYTCEYKGYMVGIGAHPAINNLGMWNMVWLTTPEDLLNELLGTGGGDSAMSTNTLPYIVGTGWQHLDDGTLITAAALKLTPLDFIDRIEMDDNFEDLIITSVMPNWIAQCRGKADSFSARHLPHIIQVNFGGKR